MREVEAKLRETMDALYDLYDKTQAQPAQVRESVFSLAEDIDLFLGSDNRLKTKGAA